MKSNARRKGGAAGGAVEGGGGSNNGIVIEATDRKARRKQKRLQAKKRKHVHRAEQHHQTPSSSSSSSAPSSSSKAVNDDDGNKRVKFSSKVREKTIPSVKNRVPVGLKKQTNKTNNDDDDDDEPSDGKSTTKKKKRNKSNNAAIDYENLDDETAAAFRRDDVEIDYLEGSLGYETSSRKGKKELNREYARNEGFGDDFGDFLMGLDDLVERVVVGDDDDDDDDGSGDEGGASGEDDGGSDDDDDDDDDEQRYPKNNISPDEGSADESYESADDSRRFDEDPYADLDEDAALALRSDDAEIAALEEKLGLANSKKSKKKLNREFASTFQGYGEDFGDFLNDLDDLGDRVRSGGQGRSGEYSSEDDDDDSRGSVDTDGDDSDANSHDEDDDESEEEEDDAEVADHDAALTYRPALGEDIYGNKIDSAGDGGGVKPSKYVPPHMRKKLENRNQDSAREEFGSNNDDATPGLTTRIAADPETIRRIQRALNSALNRLSDQTLESVSKSIVTQLYSQYPFHDVNDCLWKNVLSACVPPHMIMTGLIPLYVGAMAGVHWLGGDGIQLGGSMMEWSVTSLYASLEKARRRKKDSARSNGDVENEQQQQHEKINKEASNLLLIVCYLYNYGAVHGTLIYDLVRDFIANFTEMDVEALLIVLSHCGRQLRSDDPGVLREIVLLVKDRAQKAADDNDGQDEAAAATADSSRIQYMVDTIMELKNNKPRKQDAVLREKTSALKKIIGRVKSSASQSLAGKKSGSCLRVSLRDLLDAEVKGRWWVQGASWAGSDQQHRENLLWNNDEDAGGEDEIYASNNGGISSASKKKAASNNSEEDTLLALAASQRMNTDARRSVFCIVMGSTDYTDAFEKLVRAGMLKPKAERDVIRVLVHCCGEERAYNPFYAHLAMRICEYQGKSKFTLMLTFWDVFKMLDSYGVRKAANLAKLLAQLILGGDGATASDTNNNGSKDKPCLTIGVLKRMDFSPSDMPEMVIVFLSIFMTELFDSCHDDNNIQAIFAHGASSTNGTNSSSSSTGKKKRQYDEFGDCDDDDESESGKKETTKKEDLSDLRESLSTFMLQYLTSSPKNEEGSKFGTNLMTAIHTCDES